MSSKTADKPRGAAGKFISKEKAENITSESIPELISKSSKMTGALKQIKESSQEKVLEKPLISVSVSNPVSWFMKWLNSLKKKQTTTFTFRLGIPLIALPVFIAAFAATFFGLGKVTTQAENKLSPTPSPVPYSMSRVGTIYGITKQDGISTQYFLLLTSGEAIELESPVTINLSKLGNKRVLATGKFDSTQNKLIVENVADLEILPISPTLVPVTTITPPPISETVTS